MKKRKTRSPFLEELKAWDSLEVGPVDVQPGEVKAKYTLRSGRSEETTEFVCKYEEEVFQPGDPASINLASMVAAQPALNYGLFCDKIVFRGDYDRVDRGFLGEMAENTAREIYTVKFLRPNPFLTGKAAAMKPEKGKKYCRATLEYPDPDPGKGVWSSWPTEKNSVAVLSSGGKDSLLSYGLLKDMGAEVHPVFINESGRHWFTALNAYRSFRETVPNTARVWMNSDRLFAWMLRRMPFIRKDFADVRADIYPIRLWTLAVFIFGALPLAKKSGSGRVVIGNEYDTSVRSSVKGIPSYLGLYDQSIWFDNAMSRYSMRKGWFLSQFSMLRQLSELLIQKVLVERYPDLQALQVSCHAAHRGEDRFLPCGSCEKCRRIVGMLSALNADPRMCGYNDVQIERCLKSVAEKGVSQESAGAEQLAFMLREKGLLDPKGSAVGNPVPHTEIMKLRFDPRRSPHSGIPVDIRKKLYRILLMHSDGAVKREGRTWKDYDPFTDLELDAPYPFEPGGSGDVDTRSVRGRGNDRNAEKGYLWAEMSWPEIRDRIREVDVALLPVGSIEQHGPHLPVDTDAFDAEYLARRIAQACSDPRPLVLPLVPYGVSYEHEEFPGTLGVDNETLARFVREIGLSAARNGINKLVIINGHGGNYPALNFAAQAITRDAKIFVCVDTGETSDFDIYGLIDTPNDIHAGEIETSTSLSVRPELVKMDRAVKSIPRFSNRYLDFTSKRGVSWYVRTKKISESGIIGDPTRATREKGDRFWSLMIAHLVSLVEDLKSMTLDEIYQKRY